MSTPAAENLRRRTYQLLQPGDIALDGCIVHTGFEGAEDIAMHQATVEIGERIAEATGIDPEETYVYSGTQDAEFASNQHQGLTLDDDAFVWECQQLLRDGSFDLVFYFEANADLEGLVADLRAEGYRVTPVRGDEAPPDAEA
ncbi:MAG: DUF5778 family protein [Haloarculaceae archaeon]